MPCLRHGPMERSPWIPILNVRIHYLSYSKIRMPYRILSILVPGWIQYSDMVLGICPGTRMPVQPSDALQQQVHRAQFRNHVIEIDIQ